MASRLEVLFSSIFHIICYHCLKFQARDSDRVKFQTGSGLLEAMKRWALKHTHCSLKKLFQHARSPNLTRGSLAFRKRFTHSTVNFWPQNANVYMCVFPANFLRLHSCVRHIALCSVVVLVVSHSSSSRKV